MVNYPSGQGPNRKTNPRKSNKKQTIYSSRGMSLEDRINSSNEYYLTRNIAVVHKKPTPIQVVTVDYPHRSRARITEAYYRHASTTDYNGVYQGRYIDFEAKETKNKTLFPLANLPDHQIKHMDNCYQQGGIVFLIVSFKAHNEIYLLPYERLADYIEREKTRSFSYQFVKDAGYLCPVGVLPMIDYLKALDQYLIDIESE